jgi:hypothetical protein
MGKKNDLDLQTFQIYQDEETTTPPPEENIQKKKKFSMLSFSKKEKASNSVDAESNTDEHPSDSVSINKSSNIIAILKGMGIGLAVVLLIVIADQLMR